MPGGEMKRWKGFGGGGGDVGSCSSPKHEESQKKTRHPINLGLLVMTEKWKPHRLTGLLSEKSRRRLLPLPLTFPKGTRSLQHDGPDGQQSSSDVLPPFQLMCTLPTLLVLEDDKVNSSYVVLTTTTTFNPRAFWVASISLVNWQSWSA